MATTLVGNWNRYPCSPPKNLEAICHDILGSQSTGGPAARWPVLSPETWIPNMTPYLKGDIFEKNTSFLVSMFAGGYLSLEKPRLNSASQPGVVKSDSWKFKDIFNGLNGPCCFRSVERLANRPKSDQWKCWLSSYCWWKKSCTSWGW